MPHATGSLRRRPGERQQRAGRAVCVPRPAARTHLPTAVRGPSGTQAPESWGPRRDARASLRPTDHRASRPPAFLESFRKCLRTRCALGYVVPPRVWKLGLQGRGPATAVSRFSPRLSLLVRPAYAARLSRPVRPLELVFLYPKNCPYRRDPWKVLLKIKKIVETSIPSFSSPKWQQNQENR